MNIQFGGTILVDETYHPYDKYLTSEVMNKSDNIIQIHSETGDMNFIKVKNVKGISGVLGHYFNIGVSDQIRLDEINKVLKGV